MTTKLKSATTRANGAKSRGPKTASTREKSSRNSLRHGFTSRSTILLSCEDPALFHQVRAEYIAAYQPATAAESDLVDEMVAARWRIQRIWTIETALIDSGLLRQRSKPQPQLATDDPGIHLALAFRALADESRSLALASRSLALASIASTSAPTRPFAKCSRSEKRKPPPSKPFGPAASPRSRPAPLPSRRRRLSLTC